MNKLYTAVAVSRVSRSVGSRGSRGGTLIKQTLFAPCTKFLQKEREKQLTSM